MTNMNDMMNKMMEQMMPKMMEMMMTSMMNAMMGSMAPQEAPAEVETPVSQPKSKPQTLSREDFLALSEEFEEATVPMELDFVVYGSRTARYNRSVPSDIWTANHIAITQKYNAKWSKKNGGYVFETPTTLRQFLQSYQIKTELTDADRHNIRLYKQERAKAKAEYYAKKAEEVGKVGGITRAK